MRQTTRRKRRKSSPKKSGSSRILIFVLIVLVLIPVCYGIYLYWQQRQIQQEKQQPLTEQKENRPEDHDRTPKPSPSKKKPKKENKKEEQGSATYVPNPKELIMPKMLVKRKEQVIEHTGYVVSYNSQWKIPNWVAYELVRKETSGKEQRGDRFIADPLVKGAIATNADYARSGYDKGHMAPAADMKWSEKAMKESFYFSNMCPQHPQLNRRGWKNLEEKIRDWAIEDQSIIVICGPIVTKNPKTIGDNKVVVPQRFFKVVLAPYAKPMRAMGFLFNNKQAVEPISTYAVSVDTIEELAQMDFFAALPDSIENAIEAEDNYYKWAN